MQRHEIPTHLGAPDRFLLGLTAKQAMQLVAAAAGAYGLLDNQALPFELRALLAALAFLFGVLAALIRPGGRAAEEWALLLLFHLATPTCLVWRPCPTPVGDAEDGWATLAPQVNWREGSAADVR